MPSGKAGLACGASPSSAMSSPVNTASDAGRGSASDTSMPVMRAWAFGERT